MTRMRLDIALVRRGLFDSRAKARAAIEAGGVVVDGAPASRAAGLVEDDAAIEATPAHAWVGRGALKLDHALTLWPIEVAGRVVLDVGASTGGFAQVCLARGAARVFAVDVGTGQLHAQVKADPRVFDISPVDARALTLEHVPQGPQLIVCDVSFISLAKALPAALALAAPGADLVALVKPQFEVGPSKVGKGGLVRDPAARRAAADDVADFLRKAGWGVQGLAPSPILGGGGAEESLIWARQGYSTT